MFIDSAPVLSVTVRSKVASEPPSTGMVGRTFLIASWATSSIRA